MPEMFLLPTAHAVQIGDDLVLLDVAADRYLCLPGGASLGLSADRRRLADCDLELGGELVDARLASRVPSPIVVPATSLPAAHADLCRPGAAPLDWTDRRDLLRASFDGAWSYPRRTFADLIAYAQTRASTDTAESEPSDDMRDLVSRFHRWACWLPAPAKCLIRSFILLRHLRRYGFDARWVFAVRTWPFEAHCWLQCGGTILDDVPDRLHAYRPILVA